MRAKKEIPRPDPESRPLLQLQVLQVLQVPAPARAQAMPPGALPPSPELFRAAARQDAIPECGTLVIVAGDCRFGAVNPRVDRLQLRGIQSSQVLDASGDVVRGVPTAGNGLRATLLKTFPANPAKPSRYEDSPTVTVANGDSASASAELTLSREDSVRVSGRGASAFYKIKMRKDGSDVGDLQFAAGEGCTFTVAGPCDPVCCPVGKADFGTGTCVAAVPDTSPCADENYIAIDGSCVATCPSGSYVAPDDRNCVAECPGNTFISEDLKSCIAACPNYISPDGESCLATCPDYIGVDGKNCVSECPSATYISEDEEKCVSACQNFISLDGKSCVATCESDEFSDSQQCLESCEEVDKLEFGKVCVDECPEGYEVSQLNPDVCVVPAPVEQDVTPGQPPEGWTCQDEVRETRPGVALGRRESPETDALDARSTGPPRTAATAAAGWWTR